MTLQTPPHPPPTTTETQRQQYLSCYCERQEQIPTVMVIFVQETFVLATFVHIRNISAVTDPILIKL